MAFCASNTTTFRSSLLNFNPTSFLKNFDLFISRCKTFFLHWPPILTPKHNLGNFWRTCVWNALWTHNHFLLESFDNFSHFKTTKFTFKSVQPFPYTLPKALHRSTFHHPYFLSLSFFMSCEYCSLGPIHIFALLLCNVPFHKPIHIFIVCNLVCAINLPVKAY